MIIYLSLLLSVLYLLYYYVTRTFNYWKDRSVVGPEPTALFGNLRESTFRKKSVGIVIKEIYEQYPDEKVVGIYRMTTPALLLRDLDVIKNIMIKDFNAFLDRGIEFSNEGIGANLFHADGERWQVLRNKFTPLFTSGKLKNMFYLLTERGDKFVDHVHSICRQESEQEVHKLVQKYTISTISACAFGLDIDLEKDKMEQLRVINDNIFTTNYFNEIDMMFPGSLKAMSGTIFPKIVSDFFQDLVKVVISQRNGLPSNRKDFMDLILEMRQQGHIQGMKRTDNERLNLELTDGIIAAQAFVFYAAGYETSATTMAFMLYELAKNPHVQDKLIAEIDEVLGRSNGEVTYENLKEMTYLTQVFDETLRLYPLVEPLQRNATANYMIPDTNVTLSKGQMVVVSPMAIHRDEKYYPEPEIFDPERFTPENSGNRHPCAYMPFGVGPRNCIGMRFAKVQSRICISKLLSNFRIEPSKRTQKTMQFDPKCIIINPLGGVYLNIVPRNK